MSVALTALLALGGCSSLPDYANPVSWYEGTVDTVGGWFSDDEAPRIEEGAASDPGGDTRNQYPNLASVPERPTATGAEEAAAIREGLVADRNNARYSETSVAPTGYPPVAPPPPQTVPATAAPAAPAPASVQQTAAPAQAPASRTSGDESGLWPNRPAPDSRIRTGVTNANVGGGTSRDATSTSAARAAAAVPPSSAPAASRTETRDAASAGAPARQTMPAPATQTSATQAPATQAPATQAPANQVAAVTTDLSALDAPAPSSNGGAYQEALANYGQGQGAYGQGGYVPSGQSYLAGTVYFGHGSAGLSGEETAQIKGIARQANEAGAGVVVLGHASSRTGDMPLDVHDRVNFDISKLRAESVARALIEGGLPADRVFVEALSDTAPAFYEIMPSGEAGNRRAEILFVY